MTTQSAHESTAAQLAASPQDAADADSRAQLWAAMFAMVSPPFQPEPDDQDHDLND